MRYIAVAAAVLATAPVEARVASSTPAGFELTERVVVAAPPAKLYAALLDVGRWWSRSHTYSGDAANLSIEAKPGGCWCERMPDGGAIEHMRIVYLRPGQAVRAQGGLGPLQGEGVTGSLTWTIKPAPGGSELTQSYVVGGYIRGGPEKLAPLVDGVMAEGLRRVKAYAETGTAPPVETR
jgi:uncharacterized protein YndB with AHSA1/START domain